MDYTLPAPGIFSLKIRHVTQDRRKRISLGAAVRGPDQAYRVWASERGFILLEPITEVSIHDPRLALGTVMDAKPPAPDAPKPSVNPASETGSNQLADTSAVVPTPAQPAAPSSPPTPVAMTAPTKAKRTTSVPKDSVSIADV